MRKCTLVLLLACFMIAMTAGTSGAATQLNTSYLQGVYRFMDDTYFVPVNQDDLTESIVRGMFQGLDDYTEYYSPEEAYLMMEFLAGQYEGIGITIIPGDEYVIVDGVFPNSPAEKAGILPGDQIVSIDDIDMSFTDFEEVSYWLLGEEGTSVKVEVMRDNGTRRIVNMIRQAVKINPVHYRIFSDAAYVRIDMFNDNTIEGMEEALEEIDRLGITRILLDLRGNGGGSVDEAVEIAGKLVPAGVIAKLDFRSEDSEDVIYTSDLVRSPYQLVVLVDDMTASASELLAGAVQDREAGTLVGCQTYGKGRVQEFFPILKPSSYQKYQEKYGIESVDMRKLAEDNGVELQDSDLLGWVKITTGLYTTPEGRSIDEVGLAPDVIVEPVIEAQGIMVSSLQPLSGKVKLTLQSRGTEVLLAEQILYLAGYLQVEPDYEYDAETAAAVKKFQAEQGLSPYGVLDFASQEKLNQILNTKLLEIDPIYSQAWQLVHQ